MSGLNRKVIKIISLGYSLAVVVAVITLVSLLKTKLKKSNLREKLSNSTYNFTLNIYFTNLGRTRTYLIFTVYFLVVILISFSDLRTFKFKNDVESVLPQKDGIIQLNNDHYEALRNKKLRISKATVKKFRVSEKDLELFISFYKNDIDTVDNLKKNPELLEKHGISSQKDKITVPDLYRTKIDDSVISGLRWYEKNNPYTHQRGFFTFIPLDSLNRGYHELTIDKVIWRYRKKKLERIKNWLIIPFELE